MVPVVLVGRDRVAPEAAVLGDVGRQLVVVAEQDRLTVAADARSFGGMVPLKVQTELAFCAGRPGWNFSGMGVPG